MFHMSDTYNFGNGGAHKTNYDSVLTKGKETFPDQNVYFRDFTTVVSCLLNIN